MYSVVDLYPPKCSHDLPSLAGLYTRKPFQSPKRYARAAGSIYSSLAVSGTHFTAG